MLYSWPSSEVTSRLSYLIDFKFNHSHHSSMILSRFHLFQSPFPPCFFLRVLQISLAARL